MTINTEVEKNANETSASLIRRFSKKVQGAGIIIRVKGNRYKERDLSKYKRKQKTLKTLIRRKEVEKLIKLGKMSAR